MNHPAACTDQKNKASLSLMEAAMSQTINLIGINRFAALFDLSISKKPSTFLKMGVSTGDENSFTLADRMEMASQNGCFAVYRSKVKQNIRIVPVHDRSKSCDLESLYQLIAHDVNQNTNIMVFSTFSDDIDAIVYNHNVAGLAQNLDITVSFYYQKELMNDAMKVMNNIVSYTGGQVARINEADLYLFADFVESKLNLGRATIYQNAPSKGDSMNSIRVESRSSNPMMEVSCKKGLKSIIAEGINLLEEDYLFLSRDELTVVLLDGFQPEDDLIDVEVDCEGKYSIAVTVVSDLTAYKMNIMSKVPRNLMGRIALSSGDEISDVTLETDSGDKLSVDSFVANPRIFEYGRKNALPESQPAWASMVIGDNDIIRLKRVNIPMFQLQDEIEGLILQPGETIKIAFLAYNEGEEYDLSVAGSQNEWDVFTSPIQTRKGDDRTLIEVTVTVPIVAKGIQSCTVTLAAANSKGKTISSFAMTLVADQTPDIEPAKIDHKVKVTNRFVETSVIGWFDNNNGNIKREAIFSAMIPPNAYVSEFSIFYNGERFSSRIKVPVTSPAQNFTIPENLAHDATFDPDDATLYARSFSLHEIISASGEKLSLVKLHHDKNRLTVKTFVEAKNEIKFEIKIEELLERTRFEYQHTLAVAQPARSYSYEMVLEDRMALRKFEFGPATNRFFAEAATILGNVGETTGFVSHYWTDEDNLSDGYDPFSKLFTVVFDVDHDEDLACDLNWAGSNQDFISRCRVKDVFTRRPIHSIFLMDTSGSMWGTRIKQARDIFHYMIRQMGSKDRFNVMRFADEEEMLSEGLLDADSENLERALEFLSRESTGGGTNIYTALVKALITLLENSSGFAIPTLYLLTDGEATSGVTDPDVILNTINYVTASRKIHINTIALGNEGTFSKTRNPRSILICLMQYPYNLVILNKDNLVFLFSKSIKVSSSLVNRLARLGDGHHIHIDEKAEELFSIAQFHRRTTKSALDKASWGVSDIKLQMTNVDQLSLSRTEFDNLVPGNEIIVSGRIIGGPETIVKSDLSYLALGSEQMSFSKYFNQAASYSGGPRFGDDYTSRARANLEMTQLLEEWRELEDEEQPELEQLIISQSTENHLLTPFVTLQVSKPTLREAMTSPAVSPITALAEAEAVTDEEAEDALAGALSKYGFRKRRSTPTQMATPTKFTTQNIKHHYRPIRKQKRKNSYKPITCGTSELISMPSGNIDAYAGDEEFVCFSSAEIEYKQILIREGEHVNVTASFQFGQLHQLKIGSQEEGIKVQVKPDKVEILKYEGDSETTLEFGSQMIGALSAARFANFTYAYYDDVMIGCKIDQSNGFSFEIGRRDEENGSSPSNQLSNQLNSDITCFGRSVSLSRCSAHDLFLPANQMPSRFNRQPTPTTIGLSSFANSLRQL